MYIKRLTSLLIFSLYFDDVLFLHQKEKEKKKTETRVTEKKNRRRRALAMKKQKKSSIVTYLSHLSFALGR